MSPKVSSQAIKIQHEIPESCIESCSILHIYERIVVNNFSLINYCNVNLSLV